MRRGQGRPAMLKVSPEVQKALSAAVNDEAAKAGVTLEQIGFRLCHSCEVKTANKATQKLRSCGHDPYTFDSRQWLWRALGDPGMTHEHARCILYRCEKLDALRPSTIHSLRKKLSDDEGVRAGVPCTVLMAIAPASLGQVVDLVSAAVREALPAIARDGKKDLEVQRVLRELFSPAVTNDDAFWGRMEANSSTRVTLRRVHSRATANAH